MRRSVAAATIWMSALAVASCTPASPASTTASPPTATSGASAPSTSASSSPTPTSTLSPDQEEAFQALTSYLELWWSFVQDPSNADLQQIVNAGTEGGTQGEVREIIGLAEDGLRLEGEMTYRGWRVGDPKPGPEGKSEIEITFCSDNKYLKLVNVATGKPQEIPRLIHLNRKVLREVTQGDWRILTSSNRQDSC